MDLSAEAVYNELITRRKDDSRLKKHMALPLLLSLSLLPGQTSSMEAPENEPPIRAEQISLDNAGAGIALCGAVCHHPGNGGGEGPGGGIGAGDHYGSGSVWGGSMTP